jgi:ABC-type sugar transport system permease subunit
MRVRGWWLYLAPAVLVMLGLGLYPFLYNLVLSLHAWGGSGPRQFVGLRNYALFLTSADFYHALRITAIYLAAIIGAEFALGLLLAFLLHSRFFGRNFLRTFILITMVMSPVVAGLIWRWMFNADWGLVNALLAYLDISPQPWLTRPDLALLSVILADLWQWTPFITLVSLAGMESISPEYREASLVDGASWLNHQRYVTLPMLRSVLMVGLLFRLLDGLRYVDQIFVMTYGGPGNATTVLGFYTYLRAFKYWQLGYAASLGLVLLAMAVTLANLLVSRVRFADETR